MSFSRQQPQQFNRNMMNQIPNGRWNRPQSWSPAMQSINNQQRTYYSAWEQAMQHRGTLNQLPVFPPQLPRMHQEQQQMQQFEYAPYSPSPPFEHPSYGNSPPPMHYHQSSSLPSFSPPLTNHQNYEIHQQEPLSASYPMYSRPTMGNDGRFLTNTNNGFYNYQNQMEYNNIPQRYATPYDHGFKHPHITSTTPPPIGTNNNPMVQAAHLPMMPVPQRSIHEQFPFQEPKVNYASLIRPDPNYPNLNHLGNGMIATSDELAILTEIHRLLGWSAVIDLENEITLWRTCIRSALGSNSLA